MDESLLMALFNVMLPSGMVEISHPPGEETICDNSKG